MTALLNRPGPAHYPRLLAKLPTDADSDLELPAGRLVQWQTITPVRAVGLHVDGGTFNLWELERVKGQREPKATKLGSWLHLASARNYMADYVNPNPFM